MGRRTFDFGWTSGRNEYMIALGPFCWFFSRKNLIVYRYYPKSLFKEK